MKTVFYSRVIDAVSDTPIENGMVVVDDDKIIYVGEEKEYDDSSAATYRLEGKTIMPGFIDAHAASLR